MRNDLRARAEWLRLETLRIHFANRETGIASSLSPVEIFVALFYGGVLNFELGTREELKEAAGIGPIVASNSITNFVKGY